MQSPSESRHDTPPDPDPVSRTVNLAWQLRKRRLEREAREDHPLSRIDDLERRCERIESAIAQLARVVDDVDTTAAYAVEFAESAIR